MRKPVLYSALFLLIFTACGKDKFNSKPTIELKSIEPTEVDLGMNVLLRLNFTDKEGDISDTLFMFRIRTNQNAPGGGETNANPIYTVPNFPAKSKGEIQVTLVNEGLLKAAITPTPQPDAPYGFEPDSLYFRIVLKDKAGNTSDTLDTPQIVVLRKN